MATERNYKVTIEETSKELTKLEKIALKDVSNALKLDEILESIPDDSFNIEVAAYVVLAVHNEAVRNGENTDYNQFLILAKDGQKYVTSSKTFWNAFSDIAEELTDELESGEGFTISVYRRPSRNFAGKYFITCSIVA